MRLDVDPRSVTENQTSERCPTSLDVDDVDSHSVSRISPMSDLVEAEREGPYLGSCVGDPLHELVGVRDLFGIRHGDMRRDLTCHRRVPSLP